MNEARAKLFCKKVGIVIVNCIGKEILPRSCKERNKCVFLYKSQVCVIWKMEGAILLKATDDVRENIKFQEACLENDNAYTKENYLYFETN